MSQVHIVIPARMGSSRFYGKPLVKLSGREMVLRVVDRAKLTGVSSIVVATDDVAIAQCVQQAGFDAQMTDAHHPSGTDRIAQVATVRAWADQDIVVNVQGDEPLIEPELIEEVALALSAHPDCVMSTAAHALTDAASLLNPNIVKVVLDNQQRALYFSRAPIPFPRDAMRAAGGDGLAALPAGLPVLRHMGIYAYRVGFLKQYADLPASPLEQFESLEQLRVLANGHQISVYISPMASAPGVDEPSDVAIVENFLAQSSK
jgi:3-deoxy-manno-octulosonate cytidylyltransferase (CMP-KDO synthetase)